MLTDLESNLILHFLTLKYSVDTEIRRRKDAQENRGGQHVSLTSDMATWSLSSLLKVRTDCKSALSDVPELELEEIRKKFNL